jgi:type 1 glutamine amidotransferase
MLESVPCEKVVPGFGSWGAQSVIARQRRFLEELRSQVGYAVALGKPPEALEQHVRISPDFQVWMPYDTPVAEDLLYVYRELTVPVAPYSGREPRSDDGSPHALALIGDGPHEPQHLERGLRPAFEAAGVVPHFTVDVRALSAENLARVKLLVILRDGLMRPTDDPRTFYGWVTKEHERTVVEFVEKGGAFLNLHNALGLYPDDGPYLKLAAGRYIGHGPLERFRVEPVDREHPVTRGITPYFVADEQHTPVVDRPRVKLLFRSRSDGGIEGDAGWVYEPGAGRLCHLANGHTREALLHPTYQQVLRNAILWCVRRDPPAP